MRLVGQVALLEQGAAAGAIRTAAGAVRRRDLIEIALVLTASIALGVALARLLIACLEGLC